MRLLGDFGNGGRLFVKAFQLLSDRVDVRSGRGDLYEPGPELPRQSRIIQAVGVEDAEIPVREGVFPIRPYGQKVLLLRFVVFFQTLVCGCDIVAGPHVEGVEEERLFEVQEGV